MFLYEAQIKIVRKLSVFIVQFEEFMISRCGEEATRDVVLQTKQ